MNGSRIGTGLRAGALVLALGCGGRDGAAADTTSVVPLGDTVAAAGGAWVARADGVGPLRVGMSADEAWRAAGMTGAMPAPPADASPGACRYLPDDDLPQRVRVMLVGDSVVRVDVPDSSIATDAGARVGDAEASVLAMYDGRVQVQPHKYDGPGAHYLVVTPASDARHRLIFETDGARVTTYRVGRLPEVAWVEGCS